MNRQETEKRLQALVPAAMKNKIKAIAAEHENIQTIDNFVRIACGQLLEEVGVDVPDEWLETP